MEYFKIVVNRAPFKPLVHYREIDGREDLADFVHRYLMHRSVLGVTVEKINQRAYIRATRPGE